MGIIKEYVDRGTQTDAYPVPSPYSDPAVVLAAPSVTRRSEDVHHTISPESHHSASISSISLIDGSQDFSVPHSPISPMLAPLVSRRLHRRKQTLQTRFPAGELPNRRIVSMPESRTDLSTVVSHDDGKRVVSMPNRIRPDLEPSVELFSSPADGSFGSYTGRCERVRVSRLPPDIPQTPSPPSSPESLLIIDAGAQFPEGFLRRKYAQDPLIEEDEDWITWANSPPRPIPALHGPLSLPYARCPSGAEGTIIEEPENVAQMIWGLGPDDQPNNNVRSEGPSASVDPFPKGPSYAANSGPPRLQKKTPSVSQATKVSRRAPSSHSNTKPGKITQSRRQLDNDRGINPMDRDSPDLESHQDILSEPSWFGGPSMSSSTGIHSSLLNDPFPVENNTTLEWRLARLRQAFRTSLVNLGSYDPHQDGLEPVIPPISGHGIAHSYPRIFVEPRPDELSSSTRQTAVEIAQQYRNQQLYRQAIQKQKIQAQNFLPTPPNSSSPQWSSHFSPYLTYGSTFSPDVVGPSDNPTPASNKYRSNPGASQYLGHIHERLDIVHPGHIEMDTNLSSAQGSHPMPSTNPFVSIRQSSSPSITLAKYIQKLQALPPMPHYQPGPPPSVPLPPLPSTEQDLLISNVIAYHPPVGPTPPSPESPPPRHRAVPRQGRSAPPTRLMQRRLSDVPEEDSIVLDLSSTVSPSRLQGTIAAERQRVVSSSHEGTFGSQSTYHGMPAVEPRKASIPDSTQPESSSGETLSVKVRLPITRDQGHRGLSNGRDETKGSQQQGQRKKHRYKKFKAPETSNGRAQAREVAG